MSVIQNALEKAGRSPKTQPSPEPVTVSALPAPARLNPAAAETPAPEPKPAVQAAPHNKSHWPGIIIFVVLSACLAGFCLAVGAFLAARSVPPPAPRPIGLHEKIVPPPPVKKSYVSQAFISPASSVMRETVSLLEKSDQYASEFKLTGITYTGSQPLALINNQVVGIGDTMKESAAVKDIQPKSVTLVYRGKEIQLSL